MYIIFFKNNKGEYHFPIYIDNDAILCQIINTYSSIVPHIIVTDGMDELIIEKKGNNYISTLEQYNYEIIKTYEKLNFSDSYFFNDFKIDDLIQQYEELKSKFLDTGSDIILNRLKLIHINILAISARDNIYLNEYGYVDYEIFITMHDNIKIKTNLYKYVFNIFSQKIEKGETLIIMPISRVLLETKLKIGNCFFIPPEYVDYESIFNTTKTLFNNDLRTISNNLNNFTIEILYQNTCVAFTYNLDWDKFRTATHSNYDIDLLRLLAFETNSSLNIIKYKLCKFDLPDTLPGEVGTWFDSNDFMGALIFNKSEQFSYLISAPAIESSRIVKGIGLDMNDAKVLEEFIYSGTGKVSKIISHALYLFNDILYSNHSTIKFIRIMTLFEYLAYPYKYKKFQTVKKYIICHSVHSKTEYHKLSNFFKILSENYRTEIVHNGKPIEEVISSQKERQQLFVKLQTYLSNIIDDMINHKDDSWDDFLVYRNKLVSQYT